MAAQFGKRLVCTLQVIYFSLFPAAGGVEKAGGQVACLPRDIGRIQRFVDRQGQFRVLFPGCLPVAAPFILFRLKRQGYSGCFVEVAEEGLYVQGRR